MLITPLWTLAKGLWSYAVLLYSLLIISRLASRVALATGFGAAAGLSWAPYIVSLFSAAFIGFRGNRTWSARLQRDESMLLDVFEAKSASAALARYRKDG